MSELRSYPKVYAIGHKLIRDIFEGPVVVQEKVDGSQFSFGVIDGEFIARSRGAELFRTRSFPEHEALCIEALGGVNPMFKGAVLMAYELATEGNLTDGWIYRAEVVSKPKHNTLEYSRVPVGQMILFDVDTGIEERMLPEQLLAEGKRLGLEVVPTFEFASISGPDIVKQWMENESCLGGCKIEGVVVKNYNRFNVQDGKMLMGKYVSEAFKEKHSKSWKVANPTKNDNIALIINALKTDARWEKAVQRRRDAGLLEGEPRDIGPMIADLMADTDTEEADWIKDQLYKAFKKQILRGVTNGFAEWYKEKLLESAFSPEPTSFEEAH